jgi:hypothetical protein
MGGALDNFEQFGRSLEAIWAIRNTEIVAKVYGCKRQKNISKGPGAEPRKFLSNLGGLEAISAIRNIEIDVNSKVVKYS